MHIEDCGGWWLSRDGYSYTEDLKSRKTIGWWALARNNAHTEIVIKDKFQTHSRLISVLQSMNLHKQVVVHDTLVLQSPSHCYLHWWVAQALWSPLCPFVLEATNQLDNF